MNVRCLSVSVLTYIRHLAVHFAIWWKREIKKSISWTKNIVGIRDWYVDLC